MLAKALLPLLWRLAAVTVQYLKAKHRWTWAPIGILGTTSGNILSFRKQGRHTAVNAILGSAQMTFFIYVAAWSPELFKVWRSYPTLTVLAVLVISELLDLSPGAEAPIQD